MTRHTTKSETGGEQFEPHVYDEPGTPPLDGADLEGEPPDDDTRLVRLAEEFFLLADDKDIDLF
jgi:hypothetical protein